MLIVTTESIPGHQIGAVIGEVVGVTARSNNPFTEGLKQLDGQANPQRTPALLRWRREAIAQMAAEAAKRGADAVIGMKFDNRQITGSWSEICAYGTAVRLVRIPVPGHRGSETVAGRAGVAPVTSAHPAPDRPGRVPVPGRAEPQPAQTPAGSPG